jgi:hypothetical protein
MKFRIFSINKEILIIFLLEFIFNENKINSFSILNKNNKFEEIKNNFIKEVEKNKLITYIKKCKLDVKN